MLLFYLLAPFQTLSFYNITLLDIFIICYLLYLIALKNKSKLIRIFNFDYAIIIFILCGVYTAIIRDTYSINTLILLFKFIEYILFFRIALAIDINKNTLIISSLVYTYTLIIWSGIHYYLYVNDIIQRSRIDLPFELHGGQQLSLAFSIIISLMVFNQYLYKRRLNIWYIMTILTCLLFSVIAGGRAGIIGILLLVIFVSNLSFLVVFIPFAYLLFEIGIRLGVNSANTRLNIASSILSEIESDIITLLFGKGLHQLNYEMFSIHIFYEFGVIACSFIAIITVYKILNYPKYNTLLFYLVTFIVFVELTVSGAIITDKLAPVFAFTLGIICRLSRYEKIHIHSSKYAYRL
jgi:hypothetical protein